MLNKKKIITHISKSIKRQTPLFFTLPKIPKVFYAQTSPSEDILGELRILLKKKTRRQRKTFRFSFARRVFQPYSILKRYSVKRSIIKADIKKRIFLLKKLFTRKKYYCFFRIKKIKGGFLTSTLGWTGFTPQSLAKRYKKSKKLSLLSFKLVKRRKRRSFKEKLKVNLVSSPKPKKIVTEHRRRTK